MAGSRRRPPNRSGATGKVIRVCWRLWSAAALVTAALALVSTDGTPVPRLVWVPPAAPPVFAAAPVQPKVTSTGLPEEHAPPTELTIASIGVRTALVDLNRDPDGTLTVPSDYQVAGWYANGPTPGEAGGPPSVIAGHVDSEDGPAVFYRLQELKPGGDIEVRGIDNVIRHFTVYRVVDYAKTAFPAAEVYAPTERAELRLITCTGDFDRRAGSYRSNLVAYATLTKDGT